MWDEIAGAALIDPSIITGQKQLYMDIDVDHGASYGKTIFWNPQPRCRLTCAWQMSNSILTPRSSISSILT